MIVYRVEHPSDGDGPYNGVNWPHRWDMRMAHSRGEHPAPQEDPRLGWVRDFERCGCDTPENLLAWFDGYWGALNDGGFEVLILDAELATVGQWRGQTVFRRDAAEVLDRLTPEVFADLFTVQEDELCAS